MALKSAYDPKIPALVGQVSGRVWEADKKLWTVPISSVHQLAEKMVKERVWNERDAAEVIELVGKITNYKDSDISLIEKSTVLPLRDYQKETLKFFINRGLGIYQSGTLGVHGEHIFHYVNTVADLKHVSEFKKDPINYYKFLKSESGIKRLIFPKPDEVYP